MNHLSKTTSTYIETLGCAKNRVDSEIMLSCLLQHHFQYCEFPEKADVIIVNTCGFLTSAVTESIERILELAQNKTTGKCKKLVVAGCMSERYQDSLLEELPEVDAIIGTSDYTQIVSCINQALVEEERKSYFQKRPLYSSNNLNIQRVLSTKKHYSFLKISEGCSNMCSFCNIPALRGRFSSRLMPHIKAEFEQMLAWGIREINLISQDSSSYGIDLPKQHSLLNLVDLLLNNSNDVFWLRIFYS